METTNYKLSPAWLNDKDLTDDWIYEEFGHEDGARNKERSTYQYAFYFNTKYGCPARLWEAVWQYGGNVVTFRYADAEIFDNNNKQEMFDYLEELFSSCEDNDTELNEPRLTHKLENRGDRIEVSFWWEERI